MWRAWSANGKLVRHWKTHYPPDPLAARKKKHLSRKKGINMKTAGARRKNGRSRRAINGQRIFTHRPRIQSGSPGSTFRSDEFSEFRRFDYLGRWPSPRFPREGGWIFIRNFIVRGARETQWSSWVAQSVRVIENVRNTWGIWFLPKKSDFYRASRVFRVNPIFTGRIEFSERVGLSGRIGFSPGNSGFPRKWVLSKGKHVRGIHWKDLLNRIKHDRVRFRYYFHVTIYSMYFEKSLSVISIIFGEFSTTGSTEK